MTKVSDLLIRVCWFVSTPMSRSNREDASSSVSFVQGRRTRIELEFWVDQYFRYSESSNQKLHQISHTYMYILPIY